MICVEDGGFRLDHRWRLDRDWRTLSLRIERWGPSGHGALTLERVEGGWTLDGGRRADLDGAEEPDLSATPFCNALPLCRLPEAPGASLALDVAFVDAATLTVARSRQRYDRKGPGWARYVDLGLSAGFEADLSMDAGGLVLSYEGLFERVAS